MKKIYYVLVLTATLFAACSSDDNNQINDSEGLTIIAELPKDDFSRVVATDASDGSNYQMNLSWMEDEIIRFYYYGSDGTTIQRDNRQAKLNGGTTATFSLSKPASSEKSYLYASNIQLGSEASLLASDASYANFYLECNRRIYNDLNELAAGLPMFGAASYNSSASYSTLQFKNLCAIIKFTVELPDGVETITGVDIWGYNTKAENLTFGQNIKVTGSTNSVEYLTESVTYGSTTKTLRNNNHHAVSEKEWTVSGKKITFYTVILPQNINGLQVRLTDSDSKTYTKNKKFDTSATLQAGYMYGVNLKITAAD